MKQTYTIGYIDHTSILIINTLGRIRRLYTPFRVVCKQDHADLKKGTSIYVEEVTVSSTDELMYIINSGVYSHSYFTIVASF